MKLVKILTATSVLALSSLSASAYNTVKCDSDPVFSANSCNQCFVDSTARWEGSTIGFLKDDWINSSKYDKLMYKEEQEMPKMINLAPSTVSWEQKPTKAGFWEYTPELAKIYDKENEGYVLKKGQKVTWIKSKKWFYYKLTKNKAAENKNIGLLVYSIASRNILENGTINPNSSTHKECVLFKSGKKVEQAKAIPAKKQTKAPAKKLPKTGPEHYILFLLLSMILGFGVMKLRRKA